MDNSFLQGLFAASKPEEKATLIAESLFNTLSKEAALVARRCSILHWFDQKIVGALLKDITQKKSQIRSVYEQIRSLPFVEALPWGLAYNDLTRNGLLRRYSVIQPELLKTAARLAAPAYKAHRDDTKVVAEAFFCYIIADEPALASELLNELVQKAEKQGDQERIDGLQSVLEEAQKIPFGLSLSYSEILEFHRHAGRKNPAGVAIKGQRTARHERTDSISIAVVGDLYSGKSHYIASCINQLKQWPTLQMLGCSRIVAQGDTDQRYEDSYYKYLYTQKTMIPATRQTMNTNKPLIYELVFQKKSFIQRDRHVNVLFYDSSGEDMMQQAAMVQYNSRPVFNASAIIFLVDPLTMPRVAASLPHHLRPEVKVVRPHNTSDDLYRLAQILKRGQGIRYGSPIETPIAITISKSDLLKFVLQGNQIPLFLRNSTYSGKIDNRWFAIIDQEVRDFLRNVGDPMLVSSSQQFRNVSFFAVSATGWSADNSNKYPSIEPLRCLEPLLWILEKTGVIPFE